MYSHASYTLSPAILHFLPQHFTMVSPLDPQLNILILILRKELLNDSELFYKGKRAFKCLLVKIKKLFKIM
jgi:hypothetical protein